MKATEARLLDFLKKSPQFVIPIYQRTYSWTERECRQLWDDIVRSGANNRIAVHFVGSIVYVESGLSQVTHQAPLLVIDGQQRLTTVSLLLAALAESVGEGEPFDGFSRRKISNYYLLNPEEEDERHFKLILSQTDKGTLTAIVGGRDLPAERSLRVTENYELFQGWIKNSKVPLEQICRGLAKLVVVDIALNRDQDNPQLIFESMNSTGKELSQADLIRNYILMGLEPRLQTRLYEQYWRPMEVSFGQEAYGTHFDAFMRHYLTVKSGDIPNIREVYDAFKDHARISREPGHTEEEHVEGLVREIRDFAEHFCAMALGRETDQDLKRAFHDLRELRVDVAYPFLLELYHDYVLGVLPKEGLIETVRLVESYVFRRAICSLPTNSLNKTFATFTRSIRKDQYVPTIHLHFFMLQSYRRFPSDEEFEREFQTRDVYNFRSRSYWLRRFENFDRKELVPVDEYTIEHILPQNENLNQEWREALGENWRQVQEKWLHTIGNLTLTGYNAEYSDRSFAEKRDMKGGFRESPVRLNGGIRTLEVWNEDTIKRRAAELAAQAINVWKSPKVDESSAIEAMKARSQRNLYVIEDHPNLHSTELRPVFEAFRSAVLALDPCVTEEVLKLYVAYKAETNFVDLIPQAKRLRLSINMRFSDISDPRGICRDITNIGRWGNGDVEVGFSTVEEVPYIVGLVRQALEQQLGDSDL